MQGCGTAPPTACRHENFEAMVSEEGRWFRLPLCPAFARVWKCETAPLLPATERTRGSVGEHNRKLPLQIRLCSPHAPPPPLATPTPLLPPSPSPPRPLAPPSCCHRHPPPSSHLPLMMLPTLFPSTPDSISVPRLYCSARSARLTLPDSCVGKGVGWWERISICR